MAKDEFEGPVEFAVTTGTVPWVDPGEYVHNIVGTALRQAVTCPRERFVLP